MTDADRRIAKEEIPDEGTLLRSVPPRDWDFAKGRPKTAVLISDEISTDWEKYRTVADFMRNQDRDKKGHGLIRFKASVPRSKSVKVEHDPYPEYDLDNGAHTLLSPKSDAFGKTVKNRDLVEIVIDARQLSNPASE